MDFQSIAPAAQVAPFSGMGHRTVSERRFVTEYSHSHLNIALSIGSGSERPL
jgi:hypothetical protein